MSKILKNPIFRPLYYLLVFSFVCTPFQCIGFEEDFCECQEVDELDSFLDYQELGEYEDLYREFEYHIELEESETLLYKSLFHFKWGKKLKGWFKKRVVNLLKKCISLKKYENPDHCAYTVAKFKRKIDSVYKTGDIEKMLREFDKNTPKGKKIDSFEQFKDRIRYYHHNKKAVPYHPEKNRYDFSVQMGKRHNNHEKDHNLDQYPFRAVIGALEIACGSLIGVLPFPGCGWLAGALISHGATNIYEGYMQKYEEEHSQYK